MTKPIIVVKVPCKLLYVIQVKEFLIKCLTSWPYLISEFLVAYITIVASDWPRTFFTPKVFLFSISLLFVREENIMKKLLEKLLKITILTTYNMIVLSFASSCCCYLPIDFHHRLFRKWHMSFKLIVGKIKLQYLTFIHTYLFTMLHTISFVNLTLKLSFDKLTPTIFF